MNNDEYEVRKLMDGIKMNEEEKLNKNMLVLREIFNRIEDFQNNNVTLASDLKEIIHMLRSEVVNFHRMRESFREELKTEGVTGALKFMAKALHELREHVHSIKENGIKKEIQLAFTLDGYEMRKRGLWDKEVETESEGPQDFQEATKKLLDTLSEKEASVLKHRFGLLGENRKIFNTIGEIFGVSATRIKQIQSKALRKCKHPSRKHLVDSLSHVGLRKAILG